MSLADELGKIWTPEEVANLFRVDIKTVSRWALNGKIDHFRTPGGHYRFKDAHVRRAYVREFGSPSQ